MNPYENPSFPSCTPSVAEKDDEYRTKTRVVICKYIEIKPQADLGIQIRAVEFQKYTTRQDNFIPPGRIDDKASVSSR
ncbi:hypothetical protein BDN71DRAFT_121639 [Pleurotus eryngii]|uniref:Uncharacterized protein n=1 Tax=Pleurotus eryngii TaxID=5323 RepID=A0A9P6DIV5_PLEER|nr:hypothetical protein BDN71DRAFT_121639 [Pleurotus eryngii]